MSLPVKVKFPELLTNASYTLLEQTKSQMNLCIKIPSILARLSELVI